jgi:hypothetical protein
LWNAATERFGALAVDDESLVELLATAEELIGRPPDVYEEFDTA